MHLVGIFQVDPAERVERAGIALRIALQAFFQKAGQSALAAADWAVQEQDAFFNAVALGGAFESVDQLREGLIEAEDGVAAAVVWIAKEFIVQAFFAGDFVRFRAVREDHVVDALERRCA